MSRELTRPVRVLVAKVGLDGHDRGAKVIATALRDAGMEVIYTGLRQTPEMVVNAALQEDVDAIGISILSGAHMTVFPKVIRLLKEKEMNDVLLTGGGIIPEDDMKTLNEMGVGKLFAPGTTMSEIAEYIKTFKPKDPWEDPNISGLSDILGSAVETQPEKFADEIELYQDVAYIYSYRMLNAFGEAWKKQKAFNWEKVLRYCLHTLKSKKFYSIS